MAKRSFFSPLELLKNWFAVALAVLVLLALPGAVLLALNLLGKEAAVNGWMRQTFSLTYHIGLPWWAALLLFLTPFLILLLYFLKLRRKALQVPSTFLWKKSIQDLHVNSLFQWLRRNVLLLIQLLIVLLLIYAVMGFQFHGSPGGGRYYILLIDSSASMSVADGAPTRLDDARRQAIEEINAHTDRDFGMVIEFNSRAQVLQPYTSNRTLLRDAIAAVKPTQRPTRIDEALALAASLANPTRSTENEASRPAGEDPAQARTYVAPEGFAAEVHLFSDGRFPEPAGFAAGNLVLTYHRTGRPGASSADNVGLVALDARRDDKDPTRLNVFAVVKNYRPTDASVRLDVEWGPWGGDDLRRQHKVLDVHARAPAQGGPNQGRPAPVQPDEASHTFELTDIDDGPGTVVHLFLRGYDKERQAATEWRDAFPLDDQAWLVVGAVRKARVLIVTPGNALLHKFFDLEEVAAAATVQYLSPDDLDKEENYLKPAREGAFDLVVFDRCAPRREEEQPEGNTFYIDAVPPWRLGPDPATAWRRSGMPSLEGVQIRNPTSRHPLMRRLSGLDEIAFTGAFKLDLRDPRVPPRTPRLLETDRDTAVLFALTRRTYTDLVLAFPLVDERGRWCTTWPLKLSFPVFLRNVLYQLGNVGEGAGEANLRPGQVKSLRPDTAVKRAAVIDPAGKRTELDRGEQPDFVYKDAERVGVYVVEWEGGRRLFAVNLLDADESDVQPRDQVQLGAQAVAAEQPRERVLETWQWVALVALVVVVLEWVIYHRRVFA
jgi:hypothetical protein